MWRSAVAGLVGATLLGAASAQVSAPAPSQRPRIGLVLAGGGAKGAAHIGVIRVLDQLHIPVDCVVGTSMGALVGATFASGVTAPELERAVLAIDWKRTVGGQGRRDSMPIQRKLSTLTYSIPLEVGVQGGSVRLPGGLIATQGIEQSIRTLVASARYTHNFDELPIPFRAVATDMVAGEMVVLDSGDLAEAMRASMALPGVFSPVVIDGKVLSDGGITRNLPVDIARKLCADVVIAAWMSTPPPTAADLTSSLSLVTRSVDVMITANERAQIASLGPNDIGIEIPMGDIGSASFERVPEALERGRKATETRSADLARYSVSEDAYKAWLAKVGKTEQDKPMLADVKIVGLQRVSLAYVQAQLKNVAPGRALTADDIAADIERIYALGDFQRVDYDVTGPPDARVLEITPVEKEWGPNFLRFDLGLAAYEAGDIFAIMRAEHDRTWMNSLGGRWHNAAQVGRQALIRSDFYQPLDTNQRFFVQPIVQAEDDYEDIYTNGDRAARYIMRQRYAQADIGVNFGTRAQLRLGVRSGSQAAEVDTGAPVLPEFARTPDTAVELRALYDTRDTLALPTRGTFVNLRYAQSQDWFGGKFDYSLYEGVVARAFSVHSGDSLAVLVGGGATPTGDVPPTELFELGGIRSFPGLRAGELRGTSYWTAGTRYAWQLGDTSLFGQTLYAGVRFQAAQMRGRVDGLPADTLYGLAGSVAGRTAVGPFVLSLGWVNDGSWQVQFSIGRPVSEGTLLDDL
jgi:NTE family protein